MECVAEVPAIHRRKEPIRSNLAEHFLRARHGDQQAESALVNHLYPRVTRFVRAQTRNTELVEGVVQDTFLVFLKKIRAGAPADPAKIESYAFGIARFTLIARCRLLARLSETEISEEISCDNEGDSPLDIVLAEEVYAWVEKAIDRLSKERDRQLMRHYIAEELGTSDLCDLIKVSRDHLYRVLWRAKKRLGEILKESARTHELLES